MFYAKGVKVMIERKVVPQDFMASWFDGRLTQQMACMAENRLGFILLEGTFPVRKDGCIQIGPRVLSVTIMQINNRLASMALYGVIPLYSPSMHWTPYIIKSLYDLFQKDVHLSVLTRPGVKVPSSWKIRTPKILGLHYVQGLPHIGAKRALKLWERAHSLRMISVLTRDEMQETIGPKLGADAYDFLDTQWVSGEDDDSDESDQD